MEKETEEHRWGGLAVLAALAAGVAAVLLRARKPSGGPAPPEVRPPFIPPPKPKPVRFAIAAFSGKVRNAGPNPGSAGDLLTQGPFWWVGTEDNWSATVQTAGLSTIEGIPESDDALLVLVYEAPATGAGAPSSRPEGAARLREAARSGELRAIGTFAISEPARLGAAGFRR